MTDVNNDKSDHEDPLIKGMNKRALNQTEVLKFLQQNRGRLEKSLASIDKRDLLSRLTAFAMAVFSKLAGWIDLSLIHI